MSTSTEPIRTVLYPVAVLIGAAIILTTLSVAETITAQTIMGAVGAALFEIVAVLTGGEFARSKAWAPATVRQIEDTHQQEVDDIISAEMVIAQVQAEGS